MTRTTLRGALWVASALALTGYLVLAWRALSGGTAANAFEASVLDQAERFAQGRAAYPEPFGSGTPLMPVFPLAVSGLVRLFDAAVWEPRLVAVLAILLAAALVGLVVKRETQSATLGVAAAGLLLMSQGAAAGGLDGTRPESLLLPMVIAGALALRFTNGIPGALLASPLFAAACFTHPGGLVFALAALLHLAVHDRRRALAYGLGLTALVAGVHAGLSWRWGPWYNYAAWDVALADLHGAPTSLLRFVGTQLLGTLGVFTLATVLSFALPIRPWRGAVGLWTWMAFAALVTGVLATQSGLTPGEAMRPAAMILAIVGPVSAQRITQHLSSWPGGSRMGGQAVVLTALALQFVTLFAGSAG